MSLLENLHTRLAFVLIVLCSVGHCGVVQQADVPDYVTVQLAPGQSLRGEKVIQPDNQVLSVFKGIPYAAAPVGPLRLAGPQEAVGWNGTRDALAFKPICLQLKTPDPEKPESEDCLYLNIYSPNVTGSVPVMFWIHDGSFNRFAGSDRDPSGLVRNGVVAVTMNYRLGALGFMSSGDATIPGNFGLMDQNFALKWVQKNIAAFGGDPSAVTIFGESAGSACVSHHLLSPLSKGLFHRAILSSGSSLSSWAVQRPGSFFKLANYTRDVGKQVGCNNTDFPALLSCLRTAQAPKIMAADHALRDQTGSDILASPTVETTFGFLPDLPSNLQRAGKINVVDTLSGYTSGESTYLISDPTRDGLTRDEFGSVFNKYRTTYALKNDSIATVRKFAEAAYLGDETDPMTIRASLVDVLSEGVFGLPAVLELQRTQNASQASPTRHYLYEYDFKISPSQSLASLAPAWMGIPHAEDNKVVFFVDNALATDDDRKVAKLVQTMWANFAIYGNPTEKNVKQDGVDPSWTPYTKANNAMLKIGTTSQMTTFPSPDKVSGYETFMGVINGQLNPSSVVF